MDDMHGQYGYNEATLTAVINATESKIQDKEFLNKEVLNMSAALPVVNRSVSGQKLGARIADWNADFAQVISALKELNEKAHTNLNILRGVSLDSQQHS